MDKVGKSNENQKKLLKKKLQLQDILCKSMKECNNSV